MHNQSRNEAKDVPSFPRNTDTYQLTTEKPLLTRLTIVAIRPHATVHKEKDTLLGALTRQMLFTRERNSEGFTNKVIIGVDIGYTTPSQSLDHPIPPPPAVWNR